MKETGQQGKGRAGGGEERRGTEANQTKTLTTQLHTGRDRAQSSSYPPTQTSQRHEKERTIVPNHNYIHIIIIVGGEIGRGRFIFTTIARRHRRDGRMNMSVCGHRVRAHTYIGLKPPKPRIGARRPSRQGRPREKSIRSTLRAQGLRRGCFEVRIRRVVLNLGFRLRLKMEAESGISG